MVIFSSQQPGDMYIFSDFPFDSRGGSAGGFQGVVGNCHTKMRDENA